MKRLTLRQAFALAAVACCTLSSNTFAAFLNYGDFGPDPAPAYTMYLDVRESSGTDPVPPESRYNAPNLVGDSLLFTPSQFVAQAYLPLGQGDIIDVQLNTTIMALEENNVVAGGYSGITINEWGSYSFMGAGTSATAVRAALAVGVTILEVDGVPVPNPGSPQWKLTVSDTFDANAASDPDDGLWNNQVFIDFTAAIANLNPQFGVTKAAIVADNRLLALSESDPVTISFIDKKGFDIVPVTVPNPDFQVVPEPTTAVMLLALVAGAAGLRRFA